MVRGGTELLHRINIQHLAICIRMSTCHVTHTPPPTILQTRLLRRLFPLDDQPTHVTHAAILDRLALATLLVSHKLGVDRHRSVRFEDGEELQDRIATANRVLMWAWEIINSLV